MEESWPLKHNIKGLDSDACSQGFQNWDLILDHQKYDLGSEFWQVLGFGVCVSMCRRERRPVALCV